MRAKILLLLAIAGLGAGAAYLLSGKTQTPKPALESNFQVTKAAPTTIRRVLRISGQTSARKYFNVTAPMLRGPEAGKALVLIKLVKSGAPVKKGDLIAQIDAQATEDHLDDIVDQVRQGNADIVKRKAEQAVEWETLQQTLRQAKSDYEKAKWDAKPAGILTDIERELLQLNVEETEARYKQLQENLKFQRSAFDAEIRILEITKERQQRHHDRHALDLVKYVINAPMDGLAVMQPIFRGGEMGQIQEGDQVGPGQLFMKVVDPRSMQVDARANQAESSLLRIGQRVTVHLDAFPGVRLPGSIYSIGALAVGGWMQNYYIRNVPVNITIEGYDPRLIPDLSASGDVVIDQADNVLTVPLKAVHRRNGKPTLLVKKGDAFEQREVSLGIENEEQVEITAGLSAGEEVRIN
jgi:multidrug efflux pump subunit AcrA (membrane-fusion protein)